MLDLDPVTLAQMEEKLRLELTVLEAISLLGTLQLALRHPEFRNQPTAGWIDVFAHDLQKAIVAKAPKVAFLCDAGWHKSFDQ